MMSVESREMPTRFVLVADCNITSFHVILMKKNIQSRGIFAVNSVALMAHAFISLPLVDHDCFCKLTQDLDPCLSPVGR